MLKITVFRLVFGSMFVALACWGCDDSAKTDEPESSDGTGTDSQSDEYQDSDTLQGESCEGVKCYLPPGNQCNLDGKLAVLNPVGWCEDGQCNYGEHTESCTPGLCEDGSCTLSPCQGVTCATAPSPKCADADSIEAFNPVGYCAIRWDVAECVYASTELNCDMSCLDGRCESAACVGVNCTQSPARFCVGDNLLVYDVIGRCEEGLCSYESQLVDCGLSGCVDGACLDMDPCLYTQCLVPPASFCSDPQTLRAFSSSGVCEDGDCLYSSVDISCSEGCQFGRCVSDPCAGVSCIIPPEPACKNPSILQYWDGTPGECVGGVCKYELAEENCADGCKDGACTLEPCTGVSCVLPPANYCEGDNWVSYNTPGTCNSDGDCEYVRSETVCPDGCVQGQCLDDPCSGSDAPLSTVVLVEPLYGTAPDWNDYLETNEATIFTATGLACNGDSTIDGGSRDGEGGYEACFHGGELKKVAVLLETSCLDLDYRDELGVFDWFCDDSGSNVVLYTKGFATGKGLSDLVNESSFKENRIMVTKGTELCPAYLSDKTLPWWSNPVVPLPDNHNWIFDDHVTLNAQGTIYTLGASRDTEGYILDCERCALVTLSNARLRYAGSGQHNCNLTDGTDGLADLICIVSVSQNATYAWVEGRFDGYNQPESLHGVLVVNASFVRGKNISVQNAEVGLRLQRTNYGSYSGLRLDHNEIGLQLDANAGDRIWDGMISNNTSSGIASADSLPTMISNVTVANSFYGIYNVGTAIASIFSNVTLVNNLWAIHAAGSDQQSSYTFQNILIANAQRGFTLSRVIGSTFGQIAIVDSRDSIYLGSTFAGNYFTGNFLVGNSTVPCTTAAGIVDPPVDDQCNPIGTSDFTLSQPSGLASTFEGAVTAPGDAANSTDTNGAAQYSMFLDWTRFENRHRAWGRDVTRAYPHDTQREDCHDGECQIWDWRLRADDTQIVGTTGDGSNPNEPFVDGAGCPAEVHGDVVLTNLFGVPTSIYLQSAVEILGDHIGNDDGLCDSEEHCLYSPNFGAYQGEGPLQTCLFDDGISGPGGTTQVIDVTMYGY